MSGTTLSASATCVFVLFAEQAVHIWSCGANTFWVTSLHSQCCDAHVEFPNDVCLSNSGLHCVSPSMPSNRLSVRLWIWPCHVTEGMICCNISDAGIDPQWNLTWFIGLLSEYASTCLPCLAQHFHSKVNKCRVDYTASLVLVLNRPDSCPCPL